MRKAISYPFTLLTALLIFASCKVSENLTLDSTAVPDSEISESEPFSVDLKRTSFLGIGAPNRNQFMREARRELSKSYPGRPEQDFANAAVNFTQTKYGIVTVTKLHAEGELILERARKSPPAPAKKPKPEPETSPAPTPTPQSTPAAAGERPHFIVNARLRNTDWSMINPWIPTITALRIPGGSVAQYTWRKESDVPKWLMDHPGKRNQQTILTDEVIQTYANFVQDKDVESYFCLNINDKLENQLAIIDRFAHFGVEFTHVEIGNETYLPKFRSGRKEGLGFAHIITYEDYVDIMDEWIPALRKYPFKILAVTSSRRLDGTGGDNYRGEWNNTVFEYAANNPGAIDGVALHIYQGKNDEEFDDLEEEALNSYDYSFADAFPLPLHITEAGHRGVNRTPAGIELYKSFHRKLYEYVKSRNDGSRCGTHVLYSPRYREDDSYSMFDIYGITPMGEAAKEFPFGPP